MKKNYMMPQANGDKTKHSLSVLLKTAVLLFGLIVLPLSEANAQVGQVLWEDNFDTLDEGLWTPEIGDGCAQGICGWGNQELQSYQSDNAYIDDVPGEPGNKALVIEARRETAGGSSFTSARLKTENKVAIQYGLVEVRVRVPDLQTGLWPAAWLLGTTNLVWPAKGEIDMMEMGFNQEERNRQGEPNSTVNTYVGANAFFPIPDNGGVGSIAFDTDFNTPYVADQPLNGRFVTYRIYWEPTQLRFTVVDRGTEYDLYAGPLPIDVNGPTAAFSRPFYMLLNLAVGGTLPGVSNPGAVNAPLPGKMYVDFVRVSEYNGFGSVEFGDGELEAESGTFGVFTENTPTSNKLNFGADADIFVFSDTFSEGTEAPFEGNEVISWNFNAGSGFFGAGITSLFGKNMSNYTEEGVMKFKIKIPGDVPFRIGITDNFTNEQYINFPAGETKYGLVRNGEWGQVEIPLSDFEGLVAFQNLAYLFILSSDGTNVPGSSFAVAIDDIVWEDGSGDVGCTPTDIAASASINGDQTTQTALTADSGNNVVLNPGPAQGVWRWTGPNNFSSGQRQVSLNNIQEAGAGDYVGTYTNDCGAESTITYRVSVNSTNPPPPPPPTGDVKTWTSLNIADNIIRHSGNRGRIDSNVQPVADGEWTMVPGLAGQGVSFQSVNSPNSYLRHRNNEVWLDAVQDSPLYREDATFFVREGLANASGVSFEAFNFPGRFLRHRNFLLYVEEVNSELGRNDATFLENGGGQDGNDDDDDDVSTNCNQLSANGDYVAQVTENAEGTFLTFVPQTQGIGDRVAILYYGTERNATFPGFGISPNAPVKLNVQTGQTVYFYYTYSLPQGGERNTFNDKHSLVVGSCNGATAAFEFQLSPNPVQNRVTLNVPESESYQTARLMNSAGQELDRIAIDAGSAPSFDTSSLPKGMYFVQLIGGSKTSTKGLIKN